MNVISETPEDSHDRQTRHMGTPTKKNFTAPRTFSGVDDSLPRTPPRGATGRFKTLLGTQRIGGEWLPLRGRDSSPSTGGPLVEPSADPATPSPQVEARREALATLVRRMQDGDAAALEAFIEETQDAAWRLATSMLGDRGQAEDCLQDVYFTVHRTIRQIRDPRAAHTWLLRIVTHRCRRLQRQRPAQSLEAMAERGVEPATPDPTDAAGSRLGIEAAMAALTPPDREVITLREMLALSYEEIAASLKVPLGTVRSRLAKARQRLVTALLGRGKENQP